VDAEALTFGDLDGVGDDPASHPFASALSGSDNIVAFHTKRYSQRPLIVQGGRISFEVSQQESDLAHNRKGGENDTHDSSPHLTVPVFSPFRVSALGLGQHCRVPHQAVLAAPLDRAGCRRIVARATRARFLQVDAEALTFGDLDGVGDDAHRRHVA
jgi:hypothetical protein